MISVIDACNVSKAVESQFDINRFIYEDLNYWPLVRFTFYGQLARVRKRSYNAFANKGSHSDPIPVKTSRSLRRFRKTHIFYKYNNFSVFAPKGEDPLQPLDFLFVGLYLDYRKRSKGRLIDQYLDPTYSLFKKNFRMRKFCMLEYPCTQEKFLNPPLFYINNLEPDFKFSPEKKAFLLALMELNEFVTRLDSRFRFVPFQEYQRIIGVAERSKALLPFLDGIRPKAMLLQSFPNSHKAAWLVAGKMSGIPLIDIQHGFLDRKQIFSEYSKPIEGPQIVFPDYIATWGEETREALMESHPNPAMGKVQRTGYLWPLFKERRLDTSTSSFPFLNTGNIKVLIIHQPDLCIQQGGKDHLPGYLMKAIKISLDDINWTFRLHPRAHHLYEEFRDYFRSQELHNLTVEQALNRSIEEALKQVNVVLTSWSTVAFEANALGKSVVIFGEVGRQVFQPYLESGVFSYAHSTESLLESIRNDRDIKKMNYFSQTPMEDSRNLLNSFAQPLSTFPQQKILQRLFSIE